MSTLYETDFYAWTHEQSKLLREGRLRDADLAHIIEEIESMGRTEKRELVSRLAVLLMHLLNWQSQPGRRGGSWDAAIVVQRRALRRHLRDNPSLRAVLPEALDDAYGDAVPAAIAETGLPRAMFPDVCPWSFEQAVDEAFWPS